MNCVKICLQGHDNSEITHLNFFNDSLVSGSKNGQLIFWNLYNNHIYKLPHYIQTSIVFSQIINDNCLLIFAEDLQIHVFKKEYDPVNLSDENIKFKRKIVVNFDIPPKSDVFLCSCLVGKVLWIGTQKGKLLIVDFVKLFRDNDTCLSEIFSEFSKLFILM